ncbi:hypothetical protein RSOLAG22IIIB_06138 [Rhizoctonia solani]|uniref:Uncharacterized protein n=1 Tax=Rhizoctonia solani TaxID=456999 RepID=A0A0K6GCH1_9AGAM|nr:unnamed protein product [Rhizoctonia solani]CUA76180.1 hypothetical protein RSOLAG22IIIB_06138 [Rhizoctonia solani]
MEPSSLLLERLKSTKDVDVSKPVYLAISPDPAYELNHRLGMFDVATSQYRQFWYIKLGDGEATRAYLTHNPDAWVSANEQFAADGDLITDFERRQRIVKNSKALEWAFRKHAPKSTSHNEWYMIYPDVPYNSYHRPASEIWLAERLRLLVTNFSEYSTEKVEELFGEILSWCVVRPRPMQRRHASLEKGSF